MDEPELIMARLAEGVDLAHQGDRGAARQRLAELWTEVGEDGDALHRCAIAHSMADLQDDPKDELVWDLRALNAADLISDARVREASHAQSVAQFYPSLHLNLADVHRRLGDPEQARRHLKLGYECASTLPDDGYGQLIGSGLDRLAERLQVAQQKRL
ncbi:tetratricopeptide repeat protein [Antricoccus suffuscus]|uniref:Tetratricopeptide repeat protein n=1 Tax=Antricoccus suffuscus TaxID=1629062 RepID=A0A2T1A0S3_9ACTN|nr:tetratricopeptide repeat protein [Antricoccus suffuscus]PRZ42209.1 tetratricopeptide repeat protein [Antricoccus suffuscus]